MHKDIEKKNRKKKKKTAQRFTVDLQKKIKKKKNSLSFHCGLHSETLNNFSICY